MFLRFSRITPGWIALLVVSANWSMAGENVTRDPENTRRVLFVGDSFTHGRYLPVRMYNNTVDGGIGSIDPSPYVVDENYNTTVQGRMEGEQPGEDGPWGGIPGIFAELAHEARLHYNVHIEAISATTLSKNYRLASDVIAQPQWDAVVLQEASFESIPSSLSYNANSDPKEFCDAVETIEQAVHAMSPKADVYLYATWAPSDLAYTDTTANGKMLFSADKFLLSLAELTAAYHSAYESAAAHDGHIRAVAPVGDAWALAWLERVANPDPYGGTAPGVNLSFDYQSGSEPSTRDVPTDAGFHHPSIYGAYLSGLVLFETITGVDARAFGPYEKAAAQLGIAGQIAVELQRVAWESTIRRSGDVSNHTNGPCTTTAK